MEEKLIRMVEEAKRIAEQISACDGIKVVSHYDCDGISSAAIISKALLRAKKRFHLTLVKQLDRGRVEQLSSGAFDCFMFLDLGSGQIDSIASLLKGRTIIIADHHQPQSNSAYGNVLHLNPLVFGIEENISGAGMAYIIARAMDRQNRDLSQIAIIGAIGDAQTGSIGKGWGLLGLNREILKDAIAEGKIRLSKGIRLFGRYTRPVHKALEYSIDPYIPGITGSESASVHFLHEAGILITKGDGGFRTLADLSLEEQQKLADHIIVERIAGKVTDAEWIFGDVYELFGRQEMRDANEFATLLNACGKLEKAYMGITFCLDGDSDAAKGILEEYRKQIAKAMRFVEEGKNIRKTENAYYLLAGDRISEHIIANVASIASRSLFTEKPLFAFADSEDGHVKVSSRLPASNSINLKELVGKAALEVGGEGGGHSGAAGATIPRNSEEKFVAAVEEMLKNAFQHKDVDKPREMEAANNNDAASVEIAEAGKKTTEDNSGRKSGLEGKGLVHYFVS